MSELSVEEIQGLYGSFTVSEKLLQRIWLNKDFHLHDLRTDRGRALEIIDTGRWNHQEGPDFKEALLRIDGQEIVGDIEIHFRRADWFHHGHDSDPNYENVILHVVLCEDVGPGGSVERGASSMDGLQLMPLLLRDLEEHAMDEALLGMERIDSLGVLDELLAMKWAELKSLLYDHAVIRWEQKLAFAQKRLDRADWLSACHQAALEVLGYSRNRAPMSRLAVLHSLSEFGSGVDVERLYESERGNWRVLGSRPANHPRNRLGQYASICRESADWPSELKVIFESSALGDLSFADCADFRRRADTKSLYVKISEDLFTGLIGEKRVHTMLCDAFIPLRHVESGRSMRDYWLNWYPGDVPDRLVHFARRAKLFTRNEPMSNGLFQGLLGWLVRKGDM